MSELAGLAELDTKLTKPTTIADGKVGGAGTKPIGAFAIGYSTVVGKGPIAAAMTIFTKNPAITP